MLHPLPLQKNKTTKKTKKTKKRQNKTKKKRHMVLKALTENKVFYFSEKALRVGTATNKCLK